MLQSPRGREEWELEWSGKVTQRKEDWPGGSGLGSGGGGTAEGAAGGRREDRAYAQVLDGSW